MTTSLLDGPEVGTSPALEPWMTSEDECFSVVVHHPRRAAAEVTLERCEGLIAILQQAGVTEQDLKTHQVMIGTRNVSQHLDTPIDTDEQVFLHPNCASG